ncbi:MAG: hypothetical protein ACP5EN_09780, partial [Rhodovulum sp.]
MSAPRYADLPPRMVAAAEDWDRGVTRLTPTNGKPFDAAPALRELLVVARDQGLPEDLSAETVAALVSRIEASGRAKSAIRDRLHKLRRYARYTGEGLDWAEKSGRYICRVKEADLPKWMRDLLKRIDAGQDEEGRGLQSNRLNVACILRMLVEVARERHLPERLCQQTVEAYFETLRARGVAQSTQDSQLSLLRRIAHVSGEGSDWAIGSTGFDRRPITQVLADPLWSELGPVAEGLLQDGYPQRRIRMADRWFRHRQGLGPIDEADVLRFQSGPDALKELSATLALIDPGNLDTRIVQKASHKANKRPRPPKKPVGHDLPEPFLSQMQAIIDLPAHSRPSSSRIKAMVSALRRLLRAAADAGLPPELTEPTASAFAETLHEHAARGTGYGGRSFTFESAKAYCDFLKEFADRAGYPEPLVEGLRATWRTFRHMARGETGRKRQALAKRPVFLVDVAESANALLAQAPTLATHRSRVNAYQVAGAAALLSKLPLRDLDLRTGLLDKQFLRDATGWMADIVTSKTGTRIDGRLPDVLTPYLDAVLLMDTDTVHLWQVYDARRGEPLFSSPNDSAAGWGHTWLWRNMTELIDHGPHILRSLLYDECELDPDLDHRVAGALCGHADATMRQIYEVNA